MNIVRSEIINDIVIIDGLTRSGKFYLGKLIAGIKGLEYFINNSEAERIIAINKTGTLADVDASSLLSIAINEAIYHMAIGRNLNMRFDDGSSILNSFEKEIYINRQNKGASGVDGLKTVTNYKRSSVFIFHQSLRSMSMIKRAMPKSKIVNIRRHPVDIAYSWIKRGWGRRYGNDNLTFEPTYHHKREVVPYFAVNWAEEYLASNEHDRVVKSIVHMTEEESSVIESKQYDICCIYYDNLIEQPNKEMSKICSFLNRHPHDSMSEIIASETKDVEFRSQRIMKMNYINSGIKDNIFFDRLLDLGKRYEENINYGSV